MNYMFFHILYALSAFCFAIIACRYMILSFKNIFLTYAKGRPASIMIATLLCIVITTIAWLGLPYFFYLRSQPALYTYFVSLIFFLVLSYKKLKK